MNKNIKYLFILIFTLLLSYTNVFALTSEDIHSNEALLVNMNTDQILFEKNTNMGAVPIASLTKLMTYAVVIDEVQDLENTKIVVPDGLVEYMKSRGASRADLIDGYEYSVLDLLYGLMLPSGCDAAEVLAIHIGGGDPSVFVQKMNAKAKSLGMYDTYYVDSYGIGTATEENMSTEQDLYKLIKYVYKLPYFKQIISTEYHNIIGTKGEETDIDSVRNTNYLMGEYSGGEYYNPYSIGGKTGNLYVAGKCLITLAKKGDLEVVAITLGVPGESGSAYDYNLTDHNILFEYAFNEYTENIIIDIGPEYRSVEQGKQLKIDATTSKETTITWTSSDEAVATVDQNGIVTAISQGQTKITATTATGNLAYTYVSVDFYNGVHTKYSSGPENDNGGWDPIDYKILKDKGFDYVMIRAGYGDSTEDNTFLANIENALNNEMNVGIWYEGYAKTKEEAEKEANNLVSILSKITSLKDKINLPILYNLLNSKATDPNVLLEITQTFKKILNDNGYEVMLEIGKTKLSTMNTEEINNNNIDVSIIYRSLLPDFKTVMTANTKEADIWNYKSGAYLGKELGPNSSLSLMYMKYKKLNTIHKEYIKEENTSEVIIIDTNNKKTIKVNRKQYLIGNEEEKVIETTNKEESTDNIDVKIDDKKEKSNKKEDNNKEEKEENNFIWVIVVIGLLIGTVTMIFIGNIIGENSNE